MKENDKRAVEDDGIYSYNENLKKPPKREEKKRQKVEHAKYGNHLPAYRYYGKTRREHRFIEWLMVVIQKTQIIYMLLVLLAYPALAIGGIYYFGRSSTLIVATVLGFAIFTTLFFSRKLRRAASFYRRLQKLCKKSKNRLTVERTASQSIKYVPEAIDLILETHETVYYVHTVQMKFGWWWIYFDSATEIRMIKPPIKHLLLNSIGIRSNPKEYPMNVDFSAVPEKHGDKKVVRALVVLPKAGDMRFRIVTGGMMPTGTGGEHFGYTIFTAKSFINYIRRTAQ